MIFVKEDLDMRRRSWMLSPLILVILAAAAFWMSGCGTFSNGPPPISSQARHDHGDHNHGVTSEIAQQFAKLSPEDRAAAERQRICPVTDEPLGSMGVPLKVKVKGQDLFVCCAGCVNSVKNNPEKYLGKLRL